ncbi:MAG: TonB-dependent receptor [Bacteroidota bacterium]
MTTIFKFIKNKASVFLMFISLSSLAQNATINGTIKDKQINLPIEDVVVSIEKSNNHTHTDASGNFYFISLVQGEYEIDFNKLGYEKQSMKVIVAENETKHLDITLKSNATDLSSVDISTDRPVSAASSKYLSEIDFENRPKNSAQDMLRLVPGLFIAQHAGGGKAEQIFIRGFDCDHGTDVATFVDGIPVNMPSHGHGQGYEDLHFLIPETVEGMDIFKGPYSPRFGDFATGAAVQFNTLDSLDHNLIQLETGYVPKVKDVTAKRGLVMMQMPQLASNVNSYFAADVVNNRGYFENSQEFNRVSLFSKTTIAVTEHSHIHFSAGGFGSSWNASGQVPERAVAEGLISRFGSLDNSEGGTTQRTNLNLVYHTQLQASEFETQVYSSSYRFKLFSDFTFFLDDPINGDEIEQDDNRTIRGVNAHYTFAHKLGKMDDKFTLGASFRSDDIENQLWHAVKRAHLEARAHALIHERSTGVFANEVFRFGDHFRAEVGGRYDYFIFDVEDILPSDSAHTNYSGYNYQTLLSPKFNLIFTPGDRLQFFLNAGSGFHSNDARSVVQQSNEHQLPRAVGAEVGSLFHITNRFVATVAFWWMDITNELVYVGDDGTTEDKGPSRRTGVDVSARLQIASWLFADADVNIAKNIFIDKIYGSQLASDYYLPLAPILTSAGGLTAKFKNGIESGLRYRYMAERPANESNSVVAHGYNVVDFNANYKTKHFKIGLVIENLLNTEWNEAQFDTESRLPFESQSVEELHYTPGTPVSAKIILGYMF